MPDLDPVPWEYLYDSRLGRFLTLSQETPIVRLLDSLERPPVVHVDAPLRVLVMISSPSDMPELAVDRERAAARGRRPATSSRAAGSTLTVLEDATLTALQRALLDDFHVFHFIGHGGFDQQAQEGVPRPRARRRHGAPRLGRAPRHPAARRPHACSSPCSTRARARGRPGATPSRGSAQALVRQGLPAVVAMQTEISDRAALVFSHEFYYFLTRGLGIDAAICEVRKAMAVSDEASEWGTAVLLRSGADQPFSFTASATAVAERPESRLESLYDAAKGALLARRARDGAADARADRGRAPRLPGRHPAARARAAGGRRPADDGPTPRSRPELTLTQPPGPQPEAQPEARPEHPTGDPTPEAHARARAGAPGATALPPPPPPDPHPRRKGNGFVRSLIGLVVLFGLFWLGMTQVPKLFQGATAAVASACGPAPAAASAPATTFVAGCATTTPAIDGDFADWDGRAPHSDPRTSSPSRARRSASSAATGRSSGTASALYLRVHVVDPDVTQRQPRHPRSLVER